MASIQGVYVALFGRPADPTGLAYFNGVTNNGADLAAISNLAGQKEYTDRFAGQNNVQIVNSIYQSLFGRDAEPTGLNFFVDALNKGTLNVNNIAIAILDGAQGSDKTIVDAKLAAADLFTAAIDTPLEVGSYVGNEAAASARNWLSTITTAAQATQASADAAVAAVVTIGGAGNTITLAAGNSVVNLTTATFADKMSTNDNDTINAGTEWTAADTIDAGLGVDTFNATVAGAVIVAENGLKNVEIINLTAATAASTITLAQAKQATQVWNNASTDALTVTGLALTTTLGIKGDIGANAATFTFADVTGTADTATLALDGASNVGGTVTIAGVETLNISTANNSSIVGLTAVDTKAINISGTGTLSLVSAATSTAAETVNASGLTGAFTFDGSSQAALKSLVGGAGNDTLTVGTDSTNALSVDGGAGSDTITVVNAGVAAKAITLTGGAGADIFQIGTGGAAVANVNSADLAAVNNSLVTIADFNKAEDAIKLDVGGNARDVLLGAELTQIAAQADLLAAATLAATFTAVDTYSVFNFGTDAYLFNNVTTGFGTGDTLVKITGISAADLTAANFQVA